MVYAQQRYWSDHPRLDQIAAAYFKLPQRKTPPPGADGQLRGPALDWSLLDPETPFPGLPALPAQSPPAPPALDWSQLTPA